jgi:two-component system LytT family sensor kinase
VLRSDGEFTTLGRELELIESYLDIERARFEQRLAVRIDVPPAIRNVRIPALLLQPLVENAVKHGIAPTRAGGEIVVTARMDDTQDCHILIVVVQDTGQGATTIEMKRGRRDGVGLANIERRLSAHYGGSASLSITTARGFGTTAELRVPAYSPPADRQVSPAKERNVS